MAIIVKHRESNKIYALIGTGYGAYKSTMNVCPACAAEISLHDTECPSCGLVFQIEEE